MSLAQIDLSSTIEVGLSGTVDSSVDSLWTVIWFELCAQLLEATRGRTTSATRKRIGILGRCSYLTAVGTSDTTQTNVFSRSGDSHHRRGADRGGQPLSHRRNGILTGGPRGLKRFWGTS